MTETDLELQISQMTLNKTQPSRTHLNTCGSTGLTFNLERHDMVVVFGGFQRLSHDTFLQFQAKPTREWLKTLPIETPKNHC